MTPLASLIAEEIARAGPMPLVRYMELALTHPTHGYYMKRDPLGRAGDFITAPEISQMFGEVLGLFCADLWARAGAPPRVHWVELGPGRGTLMADARRATGRVAGFAAATQIHFVEVSPALRSIQAGHVPGARWHDGPATLPDDAPLIIIANEYFDALPIEQWIALDGIWLERRIACAEGQFHWVGDSVPTPAADAPAIYERCPQAERQMNALAARIVAQGGALLALDYGYAGPASGDTLQAMCDHGHVDPLEAPGEADLTAHVDFTALAEAARAAGAKAHGPLPQGRFLRALGLEARALKLAQAHPARAEDFLGQARRLADPDQMGLLFKALAITAPNWPLPAGFQP